MAIETLKVTNSQSFSSKKSDSKNDMSPTASMILGVHPTFSQTSYHGYLLLKITKHF